MASDPATEVALKLIKEFEGCKLKAYPDPGTGGDPWTIGWGSTGPGIKPGVVWTQQQADDRLAADVKKFGDSVKDSVTYPANPNQMGAMISLAYNIGLAAFRSSTLLRKLNSGDVHGAQEQFGRWNRAGGKVMRGLTRRRAAEAKVFEDAYRA